MEAAPLQVGFTRVVGLLVFAPETLLLSNLDRVLFWLSRVDLTLVVWASLISSASLDF
jgi:hypothetical protein